MKKIILPAVALLSVLLVLGCSSIRSPEPLDQGEHQAGISLGGPLFDSLGVPIPLPLVSADYQYGLTDNLTLGGALHITPLIFNLFYMLEFDVAYGIMDQQAGIPAVTLFTPSVSPV